MAFYIVYLTYDILGGYTVMAATEPIRNKDDLNAPGNYFWSAESFMPIYWSWWVPTRRSASMSASAEVVGCVRRGISGFPKTYLFLDS